MRTFANNYFNLFILILIFLVSDSFGQVIGTPVVTQASTADVLQGSTNQEVIKIEVEVGGTSVTLESVRIKFNTVQSSSDYGTAHIYYTGTTNTFSASNEFANLSNGGSFITSAAFNMNGTQVLSADNTHYIWLAFDVPSGATVGNYIDCNIRKIVVDGTDYILESQNPEGVRYIVEPLNDCDYTLIMYDDAGNGWQGGKMTVQVNGTDVLTDVSTSGTSTRLNFTATDGDLIETSYTPGTNPEENRYLITNANGRLIISDGTNHTIPAGSGISFYADCSPDTFCYFGSPITLDAGSGYYFYHWDDNTTEQTITINSPGTYYCTVGVIDDNIINNGDFEQGDNGSFTSDYTNATNDGPSGLGPEGTYAISTNPHDNHSGFSSCSDHTTGSGNMLVVNGATTAGESVWCQTITVTPNTDYVFSTWLTSVVSANPAELQFSINGNTLGNIFTSSGTLCQWEQFYEVWNSGSNTSIDICITNQNIAQDGNDFALDDIYFAPIHDSIIEFIVEDPLDPTITTAGPFCENDSPINLSAATSGGVWSGIGITDNDAGTFDPSTLTPGTYTITYDIPMHCISSDSIDVIINPVPTVDAGTDQSICEGDQVTLTATNPDGANISWDNNVIDGQSFTPTSTTTYTVTADLNGCISTDDVTVTVNPLPTVDAGTDQSICEGDQVTLTATNPDGANISWDNNVIDGQSFTPTSTTTYTVTADLNGCTSTDDVTVTVNPLPTVDAGTDQSICEGDQVTLTATNPDGANISWDNNVIDGQSFTPTSTTTYTVTADLNGCTSTDDVTVTVNPLPTYTVSGTNPTVCSADDGYITISGLIISTTYNVSYDNNGVTQGPVSMTSNTSGDIVITNLGAGIYTNFVVDLNGCSTTDNTSINLIDPNAPTVDAGESQTVCEGMQVTLIASNPDGANISWDNGITDGQAFTPSVGATTYTVTAELNGCTSTDNVVVTVNPLPTVDAGTDQSICEGEQVTLTASNPDGANISWDNGITDGQAFTPSIGATTYTVTVELNGCTSTDAVVVTVNPLPTVDAGEDIDICEGDNVTLTAISTSSVVNFTWDNGLGNGSTHTVSPTNTITYTVVVSDNNSCTNTDDITVNVHSLPSSILTAHNISCNGLSDGSIELTVNGGTAPYSFQWSNNSTSQNINNLSAGNYTVTIQDSYNCTDTNSAKITEPEEININFATSDPGCYGDTDLYINLDVSGGIPPYSYRWNTGDSTENLSNIPAGNYNVIVVDNNNCAQSGSVSISQPSPLFVNLPNDFVYCNDDTILTPEVSGGTPPYSYLWNNGEISESISYSTNQTNTYAVTVYDANSCSSEDEVTVTINSVTLTAYANVDSVCPGDPVMLTTSINGGTPPYTLYSDGEILNYPVIIYPFGNESKTIQVVDGCGSTDNAIVNVSTYPVPPINFNANVLQGCVPLTVHFIEVNGLDDAIYNWNFGESENNTSSNPIYTFKNPGTYDVSLEITTSKGCKVYKKEEDMITVYPNPVAKFDANPEVVSFINPEIRFVNLSEDNYLNLWRFGDGYTSSINSPYHKYDKVGNYLVTLIVESEYGCTDSVKHVVSVKDEFTLYVPTAFSPDGDGVNDGFRAVGHGIDLDNYYITVYDRWGEVIWESNDLYEEWKGKTKEGNRTVQNGTYKWMVICRDFNGVEHTKSGNVNVIK